MSLESEVEIRIEGANGGVAADLPVRKKKSVSIKSVILTSNPGLQADLIEKALEDIYSDKQIFSQVGLEITGEIVVEPIPNGVDLSDGLTLDTLQTLGTLSAEAQAVLTAYGTPNNLNDIRAIYVDSS